MTLQHARRAIVTMSLATCIIFAGFLILSPLLIESLEIAEAYSLTQIIFPVFAGYLGSAVLFLFHGKEAAKKARDPKLLQYLIFGPFIAFWFLAVLLFVFFWISNLPDGIRGMSIQELSNYVTLLVSFMNLTTGALVSFLFVGDAEPRNASKAS